MVVYFTIINLASQISIEVITMRVLITLLISLSSLFVFALESKKFNSAEITTLKEFTYQISFYDTDGKKMGVFTEYDGELDPILTDPKAKKVIDVGEKRLFVSVWIKGAQTHVYRVFDPATNTSSPICELTGWGDYKIEPKVENSKFKLHIQLAPGQFQWLSCPTTR